MAILNGKYALPKEDVDYPSQSDIMDRNELREIDDAIHSIFVAKGWIEDRKK
jgi:hypothetical protein